MVDLYPSENLKAVGTSIPNGINIIGIIKHTYTKTFRFFFPNRRTTVKVDVCLVNVALATRPIDYASLLLAYGEVLKLQRRYLFCHKWSFRERRKGFEV
jgi:hypothetical protein